MFLLMYGMAQEIYAGQQVHTCEKVLLAWILMHCGIVYWEGAATNQDGLFHKVSKIIILDLTTFPNESKPEQQVAVVDV